MDREIGERVNGPYKHGKRWRVIVTHADRTQDAYSFARKAEAEKVAEDARAQIEGRTLTVAVDAYETSLRERGLVTSTVMSQRYFLDKLLRLTSDGHRSLAWLTTKRADELYATVREGFAVATHRQALHVGKAFGKWCVKRGWLPSNPFVNVEPVGKARKGKPQLRVDECRKLIDLCLAENTPASIAVATTLLLGVRSSEITSRKVRDLDDNGRYYWIDKSKTDTSRRHLEVPEVIRERLLALTTGRGADERLFGFAAANKKWLRYHVRRLCKLAGVPVVPPHGLRGTHATLATTAGATSGLVAQQLGHANKAMTEDHYIADGAVQRAEQRNVLTLLHGGRSA